MEKNKFVNKKMLNKALRDHSDRNLINDIQDLKTAVTILKSGIRILDMKQNKLAE